GTEVLEQLTAFTDQMTTDACLALFSGARSERIVTPAIESKDSRTQFHSLIRTGFHGLLLTSTDTSNATPNTIVITKSNSASRSADTRRRRGKRGGKNHRSEWSDLGGEYCHFTLYKENKDTMEASSLLTRLMKLKY